MLIHFPKVTTTKAGPGGIQEPGSPARSPMWVTFKPFTDFKAVLAGDWIGRGLSRSRTGALTWDADITSSSVIYYTSAP